MAGSAAAEQGYRVSGARGGTRSSRSNHWEVLALTGKCSDRCMVVVLLSCFAL